MRPLMKRLPTVMLRKSFIEKNTGLELLEGEYMMTVFSFWVNYLFNVVRSMSRLFGLRWPMWDTISFSSTKGGMGHTSNI